MISGVSDTVNFSYNGSTITMNNVLRYTNAPEAGDSGGPVFIQTSTTGALYLCAMNHGYGTVSNITYGFGTKVADISFYLDIDAKTVSSNPYFGDIDNNGTVDTTDAQKALSFSVGSSTPTSSQKEAANVQCNGVVDTTDARLIMQRAAGKI